MAGKTNKAQAMTTTVWIYANTSKQVGDANFAFANREAANEWLKDFDPEGVAFEYHVFGMEPKAPPIAP